ncbi:UL24 [Gallid alphaherpesvirus 2]|uniref:Protein UL24 homolog n=3 Tax=Gallid alphaherpesvirus 2 TaxID=10390 RepID=UL24_GAHVM|nr:nuclear protein UL24 [Gallid alphaherpesvirus 2]Q9E6P4.1 RecName: Full=Protein UL24 homolog [Marek's disease herpesvirus type 1 strain MD5]ACF49533.1 UL24 [synthetic construct]AEV55003.1 UL24 [Gallid herpesvirus 2 strain 814]AAG14215.1 UL24-like protein [Gallid alphaherpesvirus 2]AAS01663.1 membrane protein [Gallid alphaherpesvirus 2]ABF72259.1 HSV-1 UL24-like protein [Gallid alphaherpesvirus 2]
MSSEMPLPTTIVAPTCSMGEKNVLKRYRRQVSSTRNFKRHVNTNVLRKRRLAAGVRCHDRFYKRLYAEAMCLGSQVYDWPGRSFAKIFGKVMVLDVFKQLTDFRLVFEVNLERRRPDCICMFKLPRDLWEVGCDGVCVILELKTCKFSRNLKTRSKHEQRLTGIKQLLDSKSLIGQIAPQGSDCIVICPMLVFVARRKLSVLHVMCLKKRHIVTDFHRLCSILATASDYKARITDTHKILKRHNTNTIHIQRRSGKASANVTDLRNHIACNKTATLSFSNNQERTGGTAMRNMANIIARLVQRP